MKPSTEVVRPYRSALCAAILSATLLAACSQAPADTECADGTGADITFINRTSAAWSVGFGSAVGAGEYTVDGIPASSSGILPPEGRAEMGWDGTPGAPWAQQFVVAGAGDVETYGNGATSSCRSVVDDSVVEDLLVCPYGGGDGGGVPYDVVSAIQCIPADDGTGPSYFGYLELRDREPPMATASWMNGIRGDATLPDLSLPGTHDSATYASTLPIARTQLPFMTFLGQMDWGVRAFDLRLSEHMNFFHGGVSMLTNLRTFLSDAKVFLSANPSEFLVAFVKAESCKEARPTFDQEFWKAVAEKGMTDKVIASKQLLEMPVSELRGRVLVVTRESGENSCGWIRGATQIAWPDDATVNPTGLCASGCTQIALSDSYKSMPVSKASWLLAHLRAATQDTGRRWFVGFSSGYVLGGVCIPGPEMYAAAFHPALWQVLVGGKGKIKMPLRCKANGGNVSGNVPRSGKLGVLFMDFVGPWNTADIRDDLIRRNPRR